jgi:hypothetical protein
MKKLFYILSFLFTFWGCESYFEPDIDSQPSYYVFDGCITNQTGPQLVMITKSLSFNKKASFEGVIGAQVTIEEKNGRTITLNGDSLGDYRTDSTISGIINNQYRLHAIMPDGNEFYSEYEPLLPSAPIDTIYGKYETKTIKEIGLLGEYSEVTDDGIGVFNTTASFDYTPYYRYECEMIYQSLQYYPPKAPIPEIYVYILRPRSSYSYLYLGNGNLYSGNIITSNTLHFMRRLILEREYNDLFNGSYVMYQQGVMVKVKQYSLTNKAYNYWNALLEQQKASSYIFDPIESQVEGNIYPENNSVKMAFGYFGASAVTEKLKAFRLGKSNKIITKDVTSFPVLDSDMFYINQKPECFIDF